MNNPILDSYVTVSSVCSGYQGRNVLMNVSMDVEKGEIVAIIGGNGAGKSTFLRTISRMIYANSGTITFKGMNLLSKKGFELPSLGIAHVPEGRRVFSKLTVLENLELGAFSVQDRTKQNERLKHAFEFFPILFERRNQPAGLLSGGEQQMLALSRALMSGPELLLLDEPSMGVAPKFVEKIFTTLEVLNREGLTIILVEQNAHAALDLSSRGYVLTLGEITLSGTRAELLGNCEVQNLYLGAA